MLGVSLGTKGGIHERRIAFIGPPQRQRGILVSESLGEGSADNFASAVHGNGANVQRSDHHPVRGAEEEEVCDRRTYRATRGIQVLPEGANACGVGLRVDEDCGKVPKKSVTWSGENRIVWGVGGDGVQPGEDLEADR